VRHGVDCLIDCVSRYICTVGTRIGDSASPRGTFFEEPWGAVHGGPAAVLTTFVREWPFGARSRESSPELTFSQHDSTDPFSRHEESTPAHHGHVALLNRPRAVPPRCECVCVM
jgi:hypothetical protein